MRSGGTDKRRPLRAASSERLPLQAQTHGPFNQRPPRAPAGRRFTASAHSDSIGPALGLPLPQTEAGDARVSSKRSHWPVNALK